MRLVKTLRNVSGGYDNVADSLIEIFNPSYKE